MKSHTTLKRMLVLFACLCGLWQWQEHFGVKALSLTVINTNDSGPGSLRQAIADASSGDTINFNLGACPCTITLTSGQLDIDKTLTIIGPGANRLTLSGNNSSRVFEIVNASTLTLTNLTIANGRHLENGGGIFSNANGLLRLNQCDLSNNNAGNHGGAIFMGGDENPAVQKLIIRNSVLAFNQATVDGGAIYNIRTNMTIINSTFSNNSARGSGGGIFDDNSGTRTLINCTLTGNRADADGNAAGNGGAIREEFSGTRIEVLRNTIVAGNFRGTGTTPDELAATIETAQNNLIGDAATAGGIVNGTNGNKVGVAVNTVLDTVLAFNYGRTRTHKLITGSPALNAGNNALALDADSSPLQTDQRGPGAPRIFNSVVDMGAFELSTIQPPPPGITGATISRQQGTPASNSQIATVSDPQDYVAELMATATPASGTGVTINNISVDGLGNVSANVAAGCAATNSTFTLRVTNSSTLFAEATLTVNVTANTAPVLNYNTQAVAPGTTPSFNPVNGPSDNGSLGPIGLTSVTPNTGLALSVNTVTGAVQVTSATQSGSYNVVISVSDNCLQTTNATFMVNVTCPTLTLAGLPGGTAGVAYNQPLNPGGGASPYMIMHTGGTLPPGLMLSNGNLTGTPAQSGTFNFTLGVRDANDCTGSQSYTVNIACPTITATVTGGGAICADGTSTVTVNISGGTAPYTMTLTNGGGTQTGNGPFTFNVSPAGTTTYQLASGTDANGCALTGSGTATVTVNPATAINSPPPSQTITIGQSVTFNVGATGQNLSYQWRKGGQPIGGATLSSYTINPVALADAGSYDVVVTGTCGTLTSAPATLAVTCQTITVTNPAVTTVTVGVAFSQTFAQTGGIGATTFSLFSGTPPVGVTLAANGTLSGTPTQLGTFPLTTRATDANGCTGNGATYNLVIACPTITFSPSSLPNATVNSAFPTTITASPASGNYSFAVSSGLLPAGLTFNSDGTFSGAPTQSGVFNFRITATGFSGGFGSCSSFRDYTLVVTCASVTISPDSLPGGTIGTVYNQTVSASPAGTYNYSVSSGALPVGLMLNAATGAITGTPAASGSYTFTITAAASSCAGSRSYTVVIGCSPITLGTLGNATAGMNYAGSVAASPGGSYTYSLVTGNLPSGVTLTPTTGAVTGLPSVTGTFSFTIKVQAAAGCSATQPYSLIVSCPNITLSALPAINLNSPYSQAVTASPSGNYSFALTTGALPTGLSLNPATGIISGTATVPGEYSFTITATSFGSCTGSRNYSGTISGGGCQTITLADLPNGSPGQLYTNSVTANPAGSYNYNVTSGSLPPGLTLYGSVGLIYGYPTTAGSYSFTVTATSNSNCTGSRQYNLTIGGAASQSRVFGDFDGDGKADLSVWRGQVGEWQTVGSQDRKLKTETWGSSAAPYFDVMTPGDYDGDGKMDLAVFRRSTGEWLIKGSNDGSVILQVWGIGTDTPVPADYDGDGKTDIAVWCGAETNWYILRSSDHQAQIVSWGTSNASYRDLPVAADFDGDGKTDIAVFRQQNGHWYIRQSSDGSVIDQAWGLGADVPVAADYDGDGKADIAVWRGSETNWYVLRSSDGAVQTMSWGTSSLGDVPVPGDYDGDGKADAAVWRAPEGSWYAKLSRDNAVLTKVHGQAGDRPTLAKSQP